MAMRVAIAALGIVLAALAALSPVAPHRAAACSMGPTPLDEAAAGAPIVVVGEVIDERVLNPQFSSDMYESTVRVHAVLKGSIDQEFTLSPLGGLGPDCSGGPRLEVGEHVLLFVSEFGGELRVYGYEQGKYLLGDGLARTAEMPPLALEDTIRTVASITGASPEQLDAALEFALSPVEPHHPHLIDSCTIVTMSFDQIAEGAPVVVVGEVIDERSLNVEFPSEAYESTVRVHAVLKGSTSEEITLSPLGYLGADCSGGPRLEAGEHVLLFLSDSRGELRVYGYEQGKYLLGSGLARTANTPPLVLEDTLRMVAGITGASPEQLDAALEFALAEAGPVDSIPPEDAAADDDGGLPVLLIALIGVAVVVLGGLIVYRRRGRGEDAGSV